MKKKNIIKILLDRINHDPMAYDPHWKWEWLPQEVLENYTLIRPALLKFEEEGYIKLIESDEIVFIVLNAPILEI